MKYILLIASFNAFFFLVLLLQKKPKALYDHIFAIWLLFLGITTATYAITIEYFLDAPLLTSGIIASFLLHGPFLYLYVSARTNNQKRIEAKNLWHFAPFLVFILYAFIASIFPAYLEGIRGDHVSHTVKTPLLFQLFLIMITLSGVVYFFLANKKFHENKASAMDFSSRAANSDCMGKLILVFGVVWIVIVAITIIHYVFQLFSMAFFTNGLFISLSVFIVLIGYLGLKQKDVFFNYSAEEGKEISNEPEIKYAATKMEAEELQQCCNKVGQFMKTNKPYLDSDLTLPKLAEDLEISTHHLSQVINEMHGKNFFNFINKYRVAEVKSKIQDPKYQNYSLLGIAYESGFNSKSAFNRAFKNVTGTTPSRYRDSLPPSL